MSETGFDIASLAPSEIPLETDAPETEGTAPEAEEAEQETAGRPAEGRPEDTGAPEAAEPAPSLSKRAADFLKSLKDPDGANKDVIDSLRKAYFQNLEFQKLYKTPAEAQAFREQFDSVGGMDALAELQEVASAVEQTDALLDRGDPEVLDQIFEDSKEGAIKLAPHYLARVLKESPEAYQRAVLPHFVSALEASNLPGVLANLERAIGDNQEARQIVRDMSQWFEDQKRLAQGYRTDSASPERDTLRDERAALERERQQIFLESVQQDVVGKINAAFAQRLSEYRAALEAMPKRAQQDFAKALYQEVQGLYDSNQGFRRQLDAMIGSRRRDRNAVVNLVASNVESVADRIVAKVSAEYGLRRGAAPKPAARQASRAAQATGGDKGTASRPTKLSGKPGGDSVDWEKTAEEAAKAGVSANVFFLTRHAVLRNGSFVTW